MKFLARVLLKILFFPLTRIFIAIFAIALVFAPLLLAKQIIGDSFGLTGQAWYVSITSTITIVAVCLVYAGYVRLFERRATVELSRKNALREFAIGAAIGSGLFTATIACLWLGGYYHVEGFGRVPSASSLMELGFVAAFLEEIVVRGVIFRITEESLGTWLAIAVSALFFGFTHIFNPESSVTAALCIAVEAGILLAAAYVTTRRLWLAIGLHFAWNFTQGGIFGVAVSGGQVRGLLKSSLTGPEYLSGGAFGPEASIFAVLVCTSAAIFLLVRAVRNGQIIRPFWSRSKTEPIILVAEEPTPVIPEGQ
jgi:membrane protease YdiL (CAAX protease family)